MPVAQEISFILQAVGSAGTLAVLIWFVIQFRTGQIVPESTVVRMIAMYEARIAETAKIAEERIADRAKREMQIYDAILERLGNVAVCPFLVAEQQTKPRAQHKVSDG